MAQAPPAPTPIPGSLFNLPGLTGWSEQLDTNDQTVVNLSSTTVVPANGLVGFTQSDVVLWWEMEVTWANTIALGGGTVFTSPYFPYNILGDSRLKIQNMYDNWHVLSGIDSAIFQLIRPMRGQRTDYDTNLGASPANTFANAALPQANLDASVSATAATNPVNFTLQIPGSLFFDEFYDLTKDGAILRRLVNVSVSPQYMGGTTRLIIPKLSFNPVFAANRDQGPFVINAAGPTQAASTATLGFRRVSIYSANQPALLPEIFNWQYIREATQFSLSGRTKIDLPLPTYGQILSIFVRMFDPSAASGGAPIDVSTVTVARLEFGSKLFYFQDGNGTVSSAARAMQRRFLQQHGFLPPVGTFIWDMGTDYAGKVTNARALNTLTTAGVNIHMEWSTALSPTAYAVVGVEALVFVQ